MRTHALMVAAILFVSSGAAFVANNAWYHMEWVRKELKPKSEEATTKPTNQSGAQEITTDSDQPQDTPVEQEGFIAIDDVLKHLEDKTARIIDAREQHEFEDGHLKGAIFVPASNLYPYINNNVLGMGVLSDDLVIVYCGGEGCDASENVADALRRDYDFTNVLIYGNGWEEITGSGRFDDYIVVPGEEE